MLENVTDPGYLSQMTPFTFQTFQCPKRLKIALVLLQSKKNFLTLYADRSLPDFLFLGNLSTPWILVFGKYIFTTPTTETT